LHTSFKAAHKYYFSLTEIVHNTEAKTLEISMKIFYDDLRQALYAIDGKKIGDDPQAHTEAIENYLNRHFMLQTDSTMIAYSYLGATLDLDAVWCFMEAEDIGYLKNLTVTNTLLTDFHPNQNNVINFFAAKNATTAKGFTLSRQYPSGVLVFE